MKKKEKQRGTMTYRKISYYNLRPRKREKVRKKFFLIITKNCIDLIQIINLYFQEI